MSVEYRFVSPDWEGQGCHFEEVQDPIIIERAAERLVENIGKVRRQKDAAEHAAAQLKRAEGHLMEVWRTPERQRLVRITHSHGRDAIKAAAYDRLVAGMRKWEEEIAEEARCLPVAAQVLVAEKLRLLREAAE